MNTGSHVFLNGTIIHDNTPFGDGLDVLDNSTADLIQTTIKNNGSPGLKGGIGVFVDTSLVVFRQTNLVQSNGDIGILARNLSTVRLQSAIPTHFTTVQGHNSNGIVLRGQSHLQTSLGVQHVVQGNGASCPTETPNPCAGIFATENSTLFLGGGTISGNQGAGIFVTGIFVEQGSNARLGGSVTVSNNSGDGVHLQRISIGDFTPYPGNGNNTITGNGGASIFCDGRSLAIGNLKGFSNVKCGD